jgi:hypothetical protein
MKYKNGEEIRVGDYVIADDSKGTVTWVHDAPQFSQDYPEGWGGLSDGLLVLTEKWGLIHYPTADEDLILVRRQKEG